VKTRDRDPESDPAAALPLVTDLQRAVHALGLHLETTLGDLGLSQGEIHVLSLLGHAGTVSVTDLQRGVRHRPSTLTGILDRLAARGMAQRRINQSDRRSNLIELTPQGRAAAERVLQVMSDVERRLFAGRPAEQRETVREILDDIARCL
jgi:DNA-binding MarR family transcriptional regulator